MDQDSKLISEAYNKVNEDLRPRWTGADREKEGADPDFIQIVNDLRHNIANVNWNTKVITIYTGRAKAVRLMYLGTED